MPEPKKKQKIRPRKKTFGSATPPKSKTSGRIVEIKLDLPNELSKTSSRGSILLEKVNKNLKVLLKAFEARIKLDTFIPKHLQEVI